MIHFKGNLLKGALAVVLGIGITGQVQAQSGVDFSGTWNRNTEKCDPGPGISINSVPVALEVNQQKDVFIITTTRRSGAGVVTVATDTLKADGSLNEKATAAGLKQTTSIQWAADHKSFTTETTYKDGTGNVTQSSKKVWSMTEDGKMRIEVDFLMNGENHHMSEVFDKKVN